ncbi:precorrin-2 dehydrogenase / sirohydrochlorin ferrochelatase [Desulfovibrionales bacterium]
MRYYPIFINLTNKRCLLVGAGRIGRRKLTSLLDAGPAEIMVVDPKPPVLELVELLTRPGVIFANRSFDQDDLEDRFLVLAASNDRATNSHIASLCARRDILCNVVNASEICSFIVPAYFCLGDLTVAISTAGLSPALAQAVARDLREQLASRYETLLLLLGRLRPLVLALGWETERNTELFRALIASPLADRLATGNLEDVVGLLRQQLPTILHDHIDTLLTG